VMPGGALSEQETCSGGLSPLSVGPSQRRLARAREWVDALGGELTLEAAADATVFVVQLPAPGLASF
jgi:hypothetical protein